MHIDFAAGQWSMDLLTYAYSYRFSQTPRFIQCTDHIENSVNADMDEGYDNITLLAKQPFASGTTVITHCAFQNFGAPLIVLAESPETDARSVVRFGNYLEIVLYENGVNVWQMYRHGEEVTWKQLMGVEFPVAAEELHTLSVRVEGHTLHITADDRAMSLYVADMYPSWYAGITACEGINRFYDLCIDVQNNEQQ